MWPGKNFLHWEKNTGGKGRYCLGVGWVMGREGGSDELREVPNGKVLDFGGVEVSSQTLGQLVLTLRELGRMSLRFRGVMSLTSSA